MDHRASPDDHAFRAAFEAGTIQPAAFDHRAHIRLAYVYLSEHDSGTAHDLMRRALLSFLGHHGIDPAKYHETMTRAWIMAVRHFMEKTPSCDSAERFIAEAPRLLDSKIMLTHYSADLLLSPEARSMFVEPDLDPIPRYRS